MASPFFYRKSENTLRIVSKLDTVYLMYIYVSFGMSCFYMSDNCLTYGVLFCRVEGPVMVSR